LVTPTYYVYFTSATIITSAILFKGFGGTPSQIITVIMGFLTICSGVVLLQLSKSAKDVPDAAVFAGDLDQLRTIAEQEQPESEPKADAIRGTAAIIRRLSTARQKMELAEARRLHDEMHMDLEPLGEDEQIEWDGLRRRRTTLGSARRPYTSYMSPRPPATPIVHPPLGMSHFPTEDEHEAHARADAAGGLGSSLLGSFRTRARSMVPGPIRHDALQSPMHPVPLTEIAIPGYKEERGYDLPMHEQKTAYDAHASFGSGGLAPAPHHAARRQFSFHNVFRKSAASTVEDGGERDRDPGSHKARLGLGSRGTNHSVAGAKGATEEERLGLVKGDSQSDITRSFPEYEEEEYAFSGDAEEKEAPPPPVPKHGGGLAMGKGKGEEKEEARKEREERERYTRKWGSRRGSRSPPPPFDGGSGRGAGAFI
jgi:hypothetical protein